MEHVKQLKKKATILLRRIGWVMDWNEALGLLESVHLAWSVSEESELQGMFDSRIANLKLVALMVAKYNPKLHDEVREHIMNLEAVLNALRG